MTVFLTSDTHFSHARIIELSNRPFATIEEHDEALVDRWNDVVRPMDIVIHLGDVALGPWPIGLSYVKRCHGYKILIPGNHDRISSLEKESRRQRFMVDYKLAFDAILSEGANSTGRELDDFIVSHYPYNANGHDMAENAGDDRFAKVRPVDRGRTLLHGHTHQSDIITLSDKGTVQYSVGVDSHNFAPVSLEKIESDIALFKSLSE